MAVMLIYLPQSLSASACRGASAAHRRPDHAQHPVIPVCRRGNSAVTVRGRRFANGEQVQGGNEEYNQSAVFVLLNRRLLL
jgi:hypothetical protein